jgi:hypothetical protein
MPLEKREPIIVHTLNSKRVVRSTRDMNYGGWQFKAMLWLASGIAISFDMHVNMTLRRR